MRYYTEDELNDPLVQGGTTFVHIASWVITALVGVAGLRLLVWLVVG